MGTALKRFKEKHGIQSTKDLILIIASFSLAGTGVGFTVRFLLRNVFHLFHKIPTWMYVCTYILFALPTYQALLLTIGAFLGQGKFFWVRFKKLCSALARLFRMNREISPVSSDA